MSDENKVNIGIIGAGSISEYHIKACQKLDNVSVRAICDVNTERAAQLATRYSIPQVFDQVEKLLSDTTIDAVINCVWNAGHAEISIKALEAGKNVLCEKPMARNAEEAAGMVEAEKASGKLLMIGLVRRYDLKTEGALSIVKSGSLGDVYYVKTGYLRRNGQPGGWFSHKEKSGGGALIDIGIHSLDLAMYLVGASKLRSVKATSFKQPHMMAGVKGSLKYASQDNGAISDVEDMILASLTFDDGLVLNLEASWAQHIPEDHQYLEIYGNKGGLQVDPELKLSSIDNSFLSNSGYSIEQEGAVLQNMFDKEIAHYRDCILGETECRSSSETGLNLMRIIDAIYQSAEEGCEVLLS